MRLVASSGRGSRALGNVATREGRNSGRSQLGKVPICNQRHRGGGAFSISRPAGGRYFAAASPSSAATPRRADVVRQQRRPAAVVPVAPLLAAGAEPLPAAMLDLDAGRRRRRGRRTGSRPRSRRRGRGGGATGSRGEIGGSQIVTSPQSCSTPVGRPLEDPAAGPALEDDASRRPRPTPCDRPATTRRFARSRPRRRGRPGSRRRS